MIVGPVSVRDVVPLIDALTAELAGSGYAEGEMFGYSVEKLEQGGVQLIGASVDGVVVGIGGVELADDGSAELKRFYVDPVHRRTGAASAIITALLSHAATAGARVVRLETGVEQHAAIRSTLGTGSNTSRRSVPISPAPRRFACPATCPVDHPK